MEFDFQWLLLGLPLAFAFGWLASRLDLRQWRRERKDSPRAYYKGLNLLLNEQHDKAIDAFIEAVQQDPDTSDLHFALGNLFRRRGEYERAVRVHEHLLHRADLPRSERDRAQHALALDFMQAGLFDRAEQGYRALESTAFETEARLARVTGRRRSRWPPVWNSAAPPRFPRALRITGAKSRLKPTPHNRPPRPMRPCTKRARWRRSPLVRCCWPANARALRSATAKLSRPGAACSMRIRQPST